MTFYGCDRIACSLIQVPVRASLRLEAIGVVRLRRDGPTLNIRGGCFEPERRRFDRTPHRIFQHFNSWMLFRQSAPALLPDVYFASQHAENERKCGIFGLAGEENSAAAGRVQGQFGPRRRTSSRARIIAPGSLRQSRDRPSLRADPGTAARRNYSVSAP